MSRSALLSPNPALERGFADLPRGAVSPMTLSGTVAKTALLVLLAVASAVPGWVVLGGTPAVVLGVVLAALVVAFVTVTGPQRAPVCAPLYAVLEGAAVGAVSSWYAGGELRYDSNVVTVVGAAALTVAVLVALLAAYASRLVRPSQNFRLGVAAATGGVALYYLGSVVASLFGVEFPLIWSTGWAGVGFSALVVVLAAANLVLDFDFIESAVQRRAPKHYEWFGAFGLLVTLVWLYLELLRLIAKAQSRR